MDNAEFHPGDIIQIRYRGGEPERYVIISERTGTNEWHNAYSLETGVTDMIQLLRGGGYTIRKLKKTEELMLEVQKIMADHIANYCDSFNKVTGLLKG